MLVLGVVALFADDVYDLLTDDYKFISESNRDRIPNEFNYLGGEYIFPQGASSLSTPPGGLDVCSQRYDWAHRQQGVDAGSTLSHFTLTPLRNKSVRVASVEIIKVADGVPPLTGALATCGGRGSGEPRRFDINLDSGSCAFFETDVAQADCVDIPVEGALSIPVVTTAYEFMWRYEIRLNLLVDGKPRTEVIRAPNGQSFVTSPKQLADGYRWDGELWVGGSASEPAPGQVDSALPESLQPCRILDVGSVSALLDVQVRAEQLPGFPGVNPATASEACYFSDNDGVRSVFATVSESPDDSVGKVEYDALVANNISSVRDSPLAVARSYDGYGGNAYIVQAESITTLIARKGSRVGVVQYSDNRYRDSLIPMDGTEIADRILLRLYSQF